MFSLYVRFNICKHQPFFIFIGLAPLCNCTNVGSIQHQVCTSILFIKSKLHCSRFAALCNFWIFKREYNSKHDRFAVAGKTLLKDCIEPITVLHVLRELSQHTWYAIQEGAQFEATIHNAKARPSPLLEGVPRLLILLMMLKMRSLPTPRMKIFKIMRLLKSLYCVFLS